MSELAIFFNWVFWNFVFGTAPVVFCVETEDHGGFCVVFVATKKNKLSRREN